jgi:hypothetical protein
VILPVAAPIGCGEAVRLALDVTEGGGVCAIAIMSLVCVWEQRRAIYCSDMETLAHSTLTHTSVPHCCPVIPFWCRLTGMREWRVSKPTKVGDNAVEAAGAEVGCNISPHRAIEWVAVHEDNRLPVTRTCNQSR